jgi:hypothetical protein
LGGLQVTAPVGDFSRFDGKKRKKVPHACFHITFDLLAGVFDLMSEVFDETILVCALVLLWGFGVPRDLSARRLIRKSARAR